MTQFWCLKIATNNYINALKTFPFVKIKKRVMKKKKKSWKFLLAKINGLKIFTGVLVQVPQAGELMFIGATSNLDEHDLRAFLLCTHSVAGALPLGNTSKIFIFETTVVVKT